jgi:hypothetical protein
MPCAFALAFFQELIGTADKLLRTIAGLKQGLVHSWVSRMTGEQNSLIDVISHGSNSIAVSRTKSKILWLPFLERVKFLTIFVAID